MDMLEQKEIAKHFTTTCISSEHIDQTNILVIKTESEEAKSQIENVETLESAFTKGLELIIRTPKYFLAIHDIKTKISTSKKMNIRKFFTKLV